ncbi:MAG TPA: hypothetical protein VJ860_00450 [Polyangia bacterium]|jgi:hypothetical protein|nr:hypothetical protein [Polyangia bacterium]
MVRVLLGLVKGGIVGAAVGFAALRVGVGAGATAWLVYGAVGFLVGLVCGKPPWRQETIWTSIVKGVIGLAVCMGLFWVAGKLLGGMQAPAQLVAPLGLTDGQALVSVPALLGPLIGIVYGVFVEVDDGGKSAPKSKGQPPKQN